MEKDKLEKAALLSAYNYANPDSDEPCYDNGFYEGFIKGAEWLMGQPLVERLTEGEKKTLRELYACYKQHEAVSKEKGLYEAEMIARGSTATMRDIFGKEMFEQ